MLHTIGLLGGTFNPVHKGHLKTAAALKEHLNFDAMYLLPCYIPPHKSSLNVSGHHRLAMLQLALADYPQLGIDEREILKTDVSYTINSLIEIRNENPTASICFCMGSDAYNHILTWFRYNELLNYAHLIITQRPNNKPFSHAINKWQADYTATNLIQLLETTAGSIYHCSLTNIPISSTQIRTDQIKDYAIKAVDDYIAKHQLYIHDRIT